MYTFFMKILACLAIVFLPAFYFLYYQKFGILSVEFTLVFLIFNIYLFTMYKMEIFISFVSFNKMKLSIAVFPVIFVFFAILFFYGLFCDDIYGLFWGNFGAVLSFFIFRQMKSRV